LIIAIVEYTTKPGTASLFTSFLKEFLDESRKAPGCISISLYENEREPGVYYSIGHWETSAARQDWLNSELYERSSILAAKMLLKSPLTSFCRQIL